MNNQWFGFTVEKTENRTFMDSIETFVKQTPECMVQYVNFDLLLHLNQEYIVPHNFKIGDWMLSAGNCHGPEGIEGITIEPPFQDLETAFDYARKKFGVNNFIEPPE